MAKPSSMLASVAATPSPLTSGVVDCSKKTSAFRSLFKGTKVATGKGNLGMVPGRTGNWLQSVRNGMTGLGGTQNGGSAPKDNEMRLGKSGEPLYTTLGGHPVSDDNNRYCLLSINWKVRLEYLLFRRERESSEYCPLGHLNLINA